MEKITYLPIRVQRQRSRGFRLPPNTKSVCRPGPFGNPIRIEDVRQQAQQQGAIVGMVNPEQIRQLAQHLVVERFAQLLADPGANLGNGFSVSEAIRERFFWMRSNLALLKNQNLACFCPLLTKEGKPNPCHVDILLPLVASGFSDKENTQDTGNTSPE